MSSLHTHTICINLHYEILLEQFEYKDKYKDRDRDRDRDRDIHRCLWGAVQLQNLTEVCKHIFQNTEHSELR